MKSSYENKITIKTWAEEDRPREKLSIQGRRALSDAELVAILIGSGSTSESAVDLSKRILNSCKNDLNALAKLSIHDLSKFKGIGEAKAISIIAALELGRRRKESDFKESDRIFTSKDIYNLLAPNFLDLPHEEFWIVMLNRANKVIEKMQISQGGLSSTVADPKIIFKAAVSHQAVNVILAHNHPSGNLKPSDADISLTKKLVAGAKILDLAIIDHVIFTDKGYFSFADESLL